MLHNLEFWLQYMINSKLLFDELTSEVDSLFVVNMTLSETRIHHMNLKKETHKCKVLSIVTLHQ